MTNFIKVPFVVLEHTKTVCFHYTHDHRNTVTGIEFAGFITKHICEYDYPEDSYAERKHAFSTISLENVPSGSFPLPSLSCPAGHITLTFLACDRASHCWGRDVTVSMDDVHEVTGIPARAYCSASLGILPPLFMCHREPVSVAYTLVCDGVQNCMDGSDETFCVFPPCNEERPFKCPSSGKNDLPQCLSLQTLLDFQPDCHGGIDGEWLKPTDVRHRDDTKDNIPPTVVNFNATAYPFSVTWRSLTPGERCPETHFQCEENDYCLPVYMLCNGVKDCSNHMDEEHCESYVCPGYYRCHGTKECVHADHMCDGLYQCPQKDDEFFCSLDCPLNCTCLGLSYFCKEVFRADLYQDVRYLDARGSTMTPAQLLNNTMLVFLCLASCQITNLNNLSFPNLHVLDVSDNKIQYVSIYQLAEVANIKTLVLAGNPLVPEGVFSDEAPTVVFQNLVFLDVSRTQFKKVNNVTFKNFLKLQTLNLSHSGMTWIDAGSLNNLTRLRILDIKGSYITTFSTELLKRLVGLQALFADDFKFCCPAMLPDNFNFNNCEAPSYQVSSCTALLWSNVYRISLSIFAVCSLMGNLFIFLVKLFLFKNAFKSGFTVFVTTLTVSDFLMGVFLAMIGIADRMFFSNYLWEDYNWRHSAYCKIAGFLGLVSSEMSATVVCYITLDRFIVVRFPLSGFRISRMCALALCTTTWLLCICIAAVPLLERYAHWQFYSQTGICVPFPITSSDLEASHYVFAIMIVYNFMLFLFIAAGQGAIYLSIISNQMAADNSTRNSRDMKIARRLIAIAVSDFLCWFPVGVLGLMASQGFAVPGEVNVTLAVIVLPLNSALNPFLYNLNIILEKRRQSRERQILEDIKADYERQRII